MEVNHDVDDIYRWVVALPGGFHIDQQGLIPLIKEYVSGSGIEDLLPFLGLSPSLERCFSSTFSTYPTADFCCK